MNATRPIRLGVLTVFLLAGLAQWVAGGPEELSALETKIRAAREEFDEIEEAYRGVTRDIRFPEPVAKRFAAEMTALRAGQEDLETRLAAMRARLEGLTVKRQRLEALPALYEKAADEANRAYERVNAQIEREKEERFGARKAAIREEARRHNARAPPPDGPPEVLRRYRKAAEEGNRRWAALLAKEGAWVRSQRHRLDETARPAMDLRREREVLRGDVRELERAHRGATHEVRERIENAKKARATSWAAIEATRDRRPDAGGAPWSELRRSLSAALAPVFGDLHAAHLAPDALRALSAHVLESASPSAREERSLAETVRRARIRQAAEAYESFEVLGVPFRARELPANRRDLFQWSELVLPSKDSGERVLRVPTRIRRPNRIEIDVRGPPGPTRG